MVEFHQHESDLQTALAFAKFFYPDVLEVEGHFLLKDKFRSDIFKGWKADCKNNKQCVEKMMNLYDVNDFFMINQRDDETAEQVRALGEVLQLFWSLSFSTDSLREQSLSACLRNMMDAYSLPFTKHNHAIAGVDACGTLGQNS